MAKGEEKAMIIAMKGHPGTGKSTLAHSIASLLKIPLLDKDHIKDSLFPLLCPSTTTTTSSDSSSLLNDLSYDVVFRLASTQLRLGLSVLIDSPLSRRSHLDRLTGLAASASARVLIVECRPSDEAEWRRRLEARAADDPGNWHKPKTWGEMEALMEAYGGCTEFDVGEVPRIVVDTTAPVSGDDMLSYVMDFIASHSHPSK